jgi:hypothetical protein
MKKRIGYSCGDTACCEACWPAYKKLYVVLDEHEHPVWNTDEYDDGNSSCSECGIPLEYIEPLEPIYYSLQAFDSETKNYGNLDTKLLQKLFEEVASGVLKIEPQDAAGWVVLQASEGKISIYTREQGGN